MLNDEHRSLFHFLFFDDDPVGHHTTALTFNYVIWKRELSIRWLN